MQKWRKKYFTVFAGNFLRSIELHLQFYYKQWIQYSWQGVQIFICNPELSIKNCSFLITNIVHGACVLVTGKIIAAFKYSTRNQWYTCRFSLKSDNNLVWNIMEAFHFIQESNMDTTHSCTNLFRRTGPCVFDAGVLGEKTSSSVVGAEFLQFIWRKKALLGVLQRGGSELGGVLERRVGEICTQLIRPAYYRSNWRYWGS